MEPAADQTSCGVGGLPLRGVFASDAFLHRLMLHDRLCGSCSPLEIESLNGITSRQDSDSFDLREREHIASVARDY